MLQATLDKYMVEEGVARYRGSVSSARERQEEASTNYGQRLLSHAIIPFATAIEEWLSEVGKKRGCARGSAYAPLKLLVPEVSAFVAARGVLDCIGLAKNYSSAVVLIGSMIEDEVRFSWLAKNHPGLFRQLDRQLDRCGSYDHKRTVIVHAMNKLGLSNRTPSKKDGEVFVPWDNSRSARVGSILIDLFQNSTGLVEVSTLRMGRKTKHVLQATEKTTEWIRGFNEYAEVLDPVWLPTVVPPTPWTTPFAGGYDGVGLPNLMLVKRCSRKFVVDTVASAQMPDVYEAINALQNTSWKINNKVHSILQHYWNVGRAIGGLPQSDDEEMPTKPDDIATNTEARKVWKRKAARVHSSNAALRSVRIQARKLLNLAQKFANVEKFYFPYQLDFRGRVYTVPTFLTPQGSDLARSLLLFADGVSMMDATDAYWLSIYGANLFGKDKITFEERAKWTDDNRENILAVAKDPLACQWWQEAEEPWQFLAWCFEWSGWLTVGAGFKTHFPVCLDGTNNGLQILSMLTRDEVAAAATNVLPGPTPADIYGEVAKRVIELMTEETETANKQHADYWLAFGVNRKTTKRPVMVLPYGGTFHSCREYVSSWYAETAKARGLELPDFKTLSARTHYLARRIWDGIEFCVGRPRGAMVWLQACADAFSGVGLPILWTAPSGFPVLQAYKEWKENKVVTTLGDSIRKVTMRTEHPTRLSRARQKNGISPNYVHSCDAAALVKTVALCRRHGIEHFAMIHDSYGTHSPRVHEMAAALRAAFVGIFRDDALTALRNQLQSQLDAAGHADVVLPPIPQPGTLNVEELYNSEFFFA